MEEGEYENELKTLYDMAVKNNDIALAFDILERGRTYFESTKVDNGQT